MDSCLQRCRPVLLDMIRTKRKIENRFESHGFGSAMAFNSEQATVFETQSADATH